MNSDIVGQVNSLRNAHEWCVSCQARISCVTMYVAIQIGLVDTLYRKSLRITAASKGRMGVGAIVNLQSNDASKLWGMAQFLHILWSGPFQVQRLLNSFVFI